MKRKEGIHRHDISDETWARIKELLPGQAGKHRERRKKPPVHQCGSVADAHGRSAERHVA